MATLGGAHTYTYDKIYQLKTVDYPEGYAFADINFNYDGVGNRSSTVDGGTTNYTPNNLNQYTQVGAATYTNDANGNLTNDGTWTYTYDYGNRLTQAAKTGTTATYKYDAFGRRVTKDEGGGTITNYLYDGDQVIAECNNQGAILAKYVFGPGIDEPLTMEKGGNTYYYHYDGLGSVTNLTDSSGSVVETYSYDVFGNPSTTSILGNRFMFTGREYDEETGLYYYRARHYSPGLGRFLQRDPVGYSAGINLYTYCANNPINWVDPFGFDKTKQKTYWDYYWEASRRQLNEPAVVSNRYLEEAWDRALGRLGAQFNPTPERVLRWGGRVISESGYTWTGRLTGVIGVAIEPGGTGKVTGIIVGGTLVAGAASFIPLPGATVAGGILGGMIGGWAGSYFDYPGAGQLNYNEWEGYNGRY